ncbi:hypothetical protein MLD38_021057 [Melastoma candidum]|uniref:Uncharacterized protein n=1 Tax=Melastoma candidum TaxID=119954 RepID=A0ACB9QGR3_9MYRT|nr:hypothetical protein MLD38_021057 [Melastoma candidum]
MRILIPYLLCLAAAACVAVHAEAPVAAPAPGLPGSWSPIKDVDDPHIKEIAEFAVSEHNKRSNSSLTLEGVASGETQVVAGVSYRLRIDCKDLGCECVKRYEAVVWEKPWLHFRRLISFRPLSGDGE